MRDKKNKKKHRRARRRSAPCAAVDASLIPSRAVARRVRTHRHTQKAHTHSRHVSSRGRARVDDPYVRIKPHTKTFIYKHAYARPRRARAGIYIMASRVGARVRAVEVLGLQLSMPMVTSVDRRPSTAHDDARHDAHGIRIASRRPRRCRE